MKAYNLLCEYVKDPLGVESAAPRFNWSAEPDFRGEAQEGYQIIVEEEDSGQITWDSGRVKSREQSAIYQGEKLKPATGYRWRVKWWDNKGNESEWSDPGHFVTGLFSWQGKWVEGGGIFRKEVQLAKARRALAFVSGLGYYELRINGRKVGDKVLDPGWSDYNKRVLYSVYDVTDYLREGINCVAVLLGHGRYLKKYGYSGSPTFILELVVDGKTSVVSDESWKCAEGPVKFDDIYDGETYDGTAELKGWDLPGYDDSEWKAVTASDPPKGKLVAEIFPPVKVVGKDKPLSVNSPRPGTWVFDFGQNFTGWLKVRASAQRGTVMVIRYSELLNPDGTPNVKNLRAARATDTYVFSGSGVEEFSPRFTYHGFRYAEITGYPGTPSIESVEREIVHSDVEGVGGFISSNELLNKIHAMVVRGQLSNLMSVPTDCPQRDERMGWMGDADLSAEEAIFNFWMPAFYENWVSEMRESQLEDGEISDVVPPFWKNYPSDPAWGIAFIEIPWLLYVHYGDKKVLEENYDSIKKYVDYLTSKSKDGILSINKYGDWCPPSHIVSPDTPRELTDTWHYYRSLYLLSKIAGALGKDEDGKRYEEAARGVAEAFNRRFFNKDRYGQGSQTSDALALYAGIAADPEAVKKHLIYDVEVEHDKHLSTGIIGTRYLFDALCQAGRGDLAYDVITQTSYPGYGYMIREGATTLWERWELLTGTAMNSHNHIMFGSVDSWLYRRVAGINVDEKEPGFSHVIFKPEVLLPGHASASVLTIKGRASIAWELKEDRLSVEVHVPVGSHGTVYLPAGDLTIDGKKAQGELPSGIEEVGRDSGLVIGISSGDYRFEVKLAKRRGSTAQRF
ncbi:family 78 glycoside hydrolase catalytic domain [Tardisphaera miroshnichenkoae]